MTPLKQKKLEWATRPPADILKTLGVSRNSMAAGVVLDVY